MVDYVLVLSPRSDATMLRLTPIDNHVRVGETFLVEIDVWPGAENVDSARTFLEFDPAVLQVVDAQGNPATAIAPGSTLATVVQNHVDNDNGRITYVATGAPGTERFLLATVRFKALATSPESALNWSLTAPRQSDLFASGTSVLDNASGGRVSIQPGAVAAGRALLQGRPTPPNPSWQTPLLVTLSRANEIGPAYLFGTMSDESGRFTIPGIVAPDAYRLRLKGLHTLRNLLADTLSTGANSINMETLLEGDAWNDNRINGHDISLLAATYGMSQGQAGYDPRADFNQDGSVNQADVSLLRENLGQQGDVLVGVSAAASNQDSTSLALSSLLVPQTSAEATVSLSLTPTSTQSLIGDVIILDVLAEAGGAQVDTAEVHLDFDPALVQLVDANGDPATVIEPGAALPIVFQNRADPARGHIDYIASSLGSAPASGQFTMARLRFRLVQTGETLVRFSFSHWRTTDVSYRGTSVLQGVTAAHISADLAPLYLPVIRK